LYKQILEKGSLVANVLIIDNQRERVQALAAVVEFLEHASVLARDGSELALQLAREPRYALAFIGAGQEDAWYRGVAAALGDAERIVPVFFLLSASEADPSAVANVPSLLGTMPFPLKQAQFKEAMERAETFGRQQRGRGGSKENLLSNLVGDSAGIRAVRRLLDQVAKTEATVLILGESGTGKEVAARTIHNHSARADKPFVPINCGAIPADLLESELFGHEKGAFTGAINARQGRFELAQGGTLFLDEIGDMSLDMQVKILRVLQEKTFERVGSNRSIHSDVRIIAATHRNLEAGISEGWFREDLFYRLNVFPVDMPPLRERTDDVPLLVERFVQRLTQEGRPAVRVSSDAMGVLKQYRWPGNVRELGNLVERLTILCPNGYVQVRDLPRKLLEGLDLPAQSEEENIKEWLYDNDTETSDAAAGSMLELPADPEIGDGMDLKEYLADLEIRLIKQALEQSGGVVAQAAKLLNLRRTTLVEKLRKYGIVRDDELTEN
jgi:sigma-54 dependent transcriptional regulator, flagellar regulatory protein